MKQEGAWKKLRRTTKVGGGTILGEQDLHGAYEYISIEIGIES